MSTLIDRLLEGCAQWNQSLTQDQLAAFEGYYHLLITANEHMNLTAITEPLEVAQRHFLDALCPPAMEALMSGASVIDVGSGAGLPGLPLAIARPDLTLTLADARKKRVDFMVSTAEALGLQNVSVVWGRAEELARDAAHRETYDAALARAVAPLPVLCEYLLPFVRVGGRMLAWKGAAAEDELEGAEQAVKTLGGGNSSLHPYAISHEFCSLTLFTCDKIRHTPSIYPRSPGKPAKNPIGQR